MNTAKPEQFADISIRGRAAYVILCFENYVKAKNPLCGYAPRAAAHVDSYR